MAIGTPKEIPPYTTSSLNILGKIRESKYRFLFIILVACLLFAPVVMFDICLAGTVLSISLIAFFWLLKENNIWHQLGIGVVAFCIAALLATALFIPNVTADPGDILQSIDTGTGPKLDNGQVLPFIGDETTLFNYSISIRHNTNTTNISAYVLIGEDAFTGYSNERNETMQLVSFYHYNTTNNNTVWIYNYSHSTHLTTLINSYAFTARVDGTWYVAGIMENGEMRYGYGPVSSDTSAIFGNLAMSFTTILFAYSFMPFLILVLFYRFSSRSSEARKKMLEQYKQIKLEKESKGLAGTKTKPVAPSEETFVCSECGADVQASAKFCPNCGEPFDDENKPKLDIQESDEKKY